MPLSGCRSLQRCSRHSCSGIDQICGCDKRWALVRSTTLIFMVYFDSENDLKSLVRIPSRWIGEWGCLINCYCVLVSV